MECRIHYIKCLGTREAISSCHFPFLTIGARFAHCPGVCECTYPWWRTIQYLESHLSSVFSHYEGQENAVGLPSQHMNRTHDKLLTLRSVCLFPYPHGVFCILFFQFVYYLQFWCWDGVLFTVAHHLVCPHVVWLPQCGEAVWLLPGITVPHANVHNCCHCVAQEGRCLGRRMWNGHAALHPFTGKWFKLTGNFILLAAVVFQTKQTHNCFFSRVLCLNYEIR